MMVSVFVSNLPISNGVSCGEIGEPVCTQYGCLSLHFSEGQSKAISVRSDTMIREYVVYRFSTLLHQATSVSIPPPFSSAILVH